MVGESAVIRLGAASDQIASHNGWGQYFWRVWWTPPDRYRDELSRPGFPTDIAIVRERVRMIYLAGERTLYTNQPVPNDRPWEIGPAPIGIFELPTLDNRFELFPLIHPPLPETAWQFETLSTEEKYDGRVTRRVRVTRRASSLASVERPHPGYMPLVDEYECIVDDEHGLILRFSAISDGVPIAIVAADDVLVDRPLPPDIFDFIPPPGSRLIHVERSS
jgi:hypothetical protein